MSMANVCCNIYGHLSTRQPCRPSSSKADSRTTRSSLMHGPTVQPRRLKDSSDNVSVQPHQSRHLSLVRAVQQHQHDMFSDHEQPIQRQHQQHLSAPDWHPRLFGLKYSRRAALESTARLYYDEVWGAGSTDLLDEIAVTGVCFNDALGMEEDAFSRASLKSIIQEFQSSHPLLKYELEDLLVDEAHDTVVAQYTVTAAHLLPQAQGASATGHVSVVTGMDKIKFTKSGLISSILSFRQRFVEEEVEPINWDAV